MCVICAGIGNEKPTHKELEQACKSNPDGFGWGAVVEHKGELRLLSGKSMQAKEAISDYEAVFREYGNHVQAHFFHARIATHGETSIRGCHGFMVEGSDKKSIIAHNGIMPLTLEKGDWRSDSRVFAEDVLPRFGGITGLCDQRVWDVMDGFVEGSNSKVVILTLELEIPLLILGESLGHWQTEGLWWSNKSYMPYNYSTYPAPKTVIMGSQVWDDEDEDSMLTNCLNPECPEILDYMNEFCHYCGWCQDCDTHWEACQCFVGSVKR